MKRIHLVCAHTLCLLGTVVQGCLPGRPLPAFSLAGGTSMFVSVNPGMEDSMCPWQRELRIQRLLVQKKDITPFKSSLSEKFALRGKRKSADRSSSGSTQSSSSNTRTVDNLRRDGFEAAMVGDFKRAADLLKEYLSHVDAPDVSALNCRGAMLAELREWEASEACFHSAIETATATGDGQARINAHFNLGNIFFKQQKLEDAAESFRSVLELRRDDVQALNNLGLVLSDQGDKHGALEAFTSAATLDSDDPVALTNQANVLADLGRHVDAVLCYQEAAERGAERDVDFWLNLGVAARRAAMTTVAEEAFQQVLAEDPDHVLAKRLLGTLQTRDSSPATSLEEDAAYAADLFDGYAQDFERELVEDLQYAVPSRLVELLLQADGRQQCAEPRWGTVVDVGCGSGLVGDFVRLHSSKLLGVDASAAMVEQARTRAEDDGAKVYDQVALGELSSFLKEELPGGAEVVVAADVLCYVSDLRPAMDAAASALRRGAGGLFAFSTEEIEHEPEEGTGWALKHSGRYGHASEWVRETVEAAGMRVEKQELEVLRMNGEEEVWGKMWVARLSSC